MDSALRLSVGGIRLNITAEADCAFWRIIIHRYTPFVISAPGGDDEGLSVSIRKGRYEGACGETLCVAEPKSADDLWISTSARDGMGYVIMIRYPMCPRSIGTVVIDPGLRRAVVYVDDSANPAVDSMICSTCLMITYLVAASTAGAAIVHASCVVKDGRAYLFTGKSGTGKSTHAALWLNAVGGCTLLNDDHPVVRYVDGVPTAFGSPWSGKTDCYRAGSAPLAAIVRLRQGSVNAIGRIDGIDAYLSVISSLSCVPGIESYAAFRSDTAAWLAAEVPNYVMTCLPDDDAALVCHAAVSTPASKSAAHS